MFTVYVKFRLRTRVKYLNISAILPFITLPMGRDGFGRDWVRTTFWDRNVDSGSTKYVDPGSCLT